MVRTFGTDGAEVAEALQAFSEGVRAASSIKQKQSIMQKTFLEFWFIGSAGSG